jgi:hypothetical protein
VQARLEFFQVLQSHAGQETQKAEAGMSLVLNLLQKQTLFLTEPRNRLTFRNQKAKRHTVESSFVVGESGKHIEGMPVNN